VSDGEGFLFNSHTLSRLNDGSEERSVTSLFSATIGRSGATR
jgi:hypothetical protein